MVLDSKCYQVFQEPGDYIHWRESFTIYVLIYNFVGHKAKRRILKRVFQENKARQMFRKTNISYPLMCEIRPFALLPTTWGCSQILLPWF